MKLNLLPQLDKLFFFKLYKHSPLAFALVLMFIIIYLFFFSKKMDMIAFPYNDMFSSKIQNSKVKKYYYVKLNNERIKISHFTYWKKDILEQTPSKYTSYLKSNHQNQLSFFLKSKFRDASVLCFLENRLTPSKTDQADWLKWYVGFSGMKVNKGDSISLVEYSVSYVNKIPILTDSSTVSSLKPER